MKILLIAVDGGEVEPLGIMFITAALKNAGHEVDLELMTSFSSDVQIKENYDFVGFSVLTGNHKHLLALCQRYREAGIVTIVGGPHATFFPDKTLKFADFVVVGEGIKAVLDIMNGVAKPGIVRTDLTPADEFPFADREELYQNQSKLSNPIKNILTGFGCPHSCNFCYNSAFNRMFPGFLRQRSVDNLIQETKELKKKYQPLELIFFQEDYFGMNLSWLEEFAERWPREINIPFHCQIRPEAATEKRLSLFKKAGCQGIDMGVETFDEEYRRDMLNRRNTNVNIFEGCRRIKKFGFKLRTYVIIGLPGRTIEDDLEDVRQLGLIQPNFARFNTYMPLRGTVLGQYCIDKGLWDGDDERFADMPMFNYSVLNLGEEHKRKIYWLQQISFMVSHLPYGYKVAKEFLEIEKPTLNDFLMLFRKQMMDELYK